MNLKIYLRAVFKALPKPLVTTILFAAREALAHDSADELMISCDKCARTIHASFMLRDDLWERTGGGDGHLCLTCVAQILERPLSLADFDDSHPVNQAIRLMLEQAALICRMIAVHGTNPTWISAAHRCAHAIRAIGE